ncbi:MAG: CHAT domain-containing protein, partial [Adhaeribacter sp.]
AKTRSLLRYGLLAPVLHQNIASAYLQIRQPDSALLYLAKIPVGDLAAGKGMNPHKALVEYYNSRGLAALQQKEAARALAFYDQARQLSLKHFSASNNRLAQAYAGKGQAYARQQRYPAALRQYQAAIQALQFNFREANIYRNPAEAGPGSSPLLLFQVLVHKARAFGRYYRQSRQEKDLQASLFAYQAAFRVSDHIRRGYDSDEAKLFYANTVAPVYEEALAAAFQLFHLSEKQGYLEAAFAMAEQSKAAVLAEGLRELEIRRVPGIPAELLRQERDLKRNMAALNQRLAEENEPARRKTYLEDLRENEIKLARTLKAFELNPAYYQLKYDTRAPAASAVVKKLDRKTALVEYVIGKKQLFVFVLSKDGLQARQIPLPAGFKRDWQELYQALYQSPAGRRYRGDAAAHSLYQVLLAPLAPWLQGKQRLVIVPDKELCYLPFEALVTGPATGRYLLQDFTLSYAYSARLQHAALSGDRPVRQASVLAMAPFVNRKGRPDSGRPAPVLAAGLLPLSASAGEVAQTGGRVYLGSEATKQRLLQQAGRYDILHLATHARADLRQPLHSYIALYPQPGRAGFRLYVPEIYNLQLGKLRLVVLSACETGGGQLVAGEGIMSLARAFAYAGCPSTITTLWKAEDQTTAYISSRLYAYLRAGKPKDAALRQAKLDYLESQDNWRRRSPVYWANFIFIGDQSPVYRASSWYWWLTGGVALAGAAGLGWLLYRSRRRARRGL